MSVAMLVYKAATKKTRRAHSYWNHQGNIGARIIVDVLERQEGYDIKFCSAETAKEHDVILISIHSPIDIYDLIRYVSPLSSWRDRTFKVIAGGAGLQNIYPLRDWIDYAVFGRGEAIIGPLVGACETGREYEHESVMALEGGVSPVIIAQGPLYPHEINIGGAERVYRETSAGCNRRCRFCYYTYARRQESLLGSSYKMAIYSNPEVWVDRIVADTDHKRQVRTALDGISWRLRLAMHKPIRDSMFLEELRQASSCWDAKTLQIVLYLITSYPTETENEWESFVDLLRRIDAPGKPIRIIAAITPFHPSPLTPGQYLPARIDVEWRRLAGKAIIGKAGDQINVFGSTGIESSYSTLLWLVATRATADSDDIISRIVFSRELSKMLTWQKVRALAARYNLDQYLREYMTTERMPTWYLNSFIPDVAIREQARQLKSDLGIPERPLTVSAQLVS